PNGSLSLLQARVNFAECGACEDRHRKNVRPPLEAEL
ncbi:CPCC family cysteine-rich protein, partial [Novosphingobium clariflavum]